MSRAEELRKKFAAKGQAAVDQIDEKKSDFVILLNDMLETESAKATSRQFVDQTYAQCVSDNPSDLRGWIEQHVVPLFVSVGEKPKWAYEASWCFDDNGAPLQFLHQFEDEDDVNFYVFRGYKDASIAGVTGKVRYLRLAAQDREGIIRLEGDITG